MEHWGEAGTPVADGGVGHLDIHHSPQDQGNVAEGVLTKIEHAQGHENHMYRVPHSLEICLSKKFGHGWRGDGSGLWHKHRMAAFLAAAGVVGVMLVVMVQIHGFAANGTGRNFFCSRTAGLSFSARLAPTDADTSYTGISGIRERLFRNDKSPFCCCTLDSLFGILLP